MSYESGVKSRKHGPYIYQNLARFPINFNFISPLVVYGIIGDSLLEDPLEPHQFGEGSFE